MLIAQKTPPLSGRGNDIQPALEPFPTQLVAGAGLNSNHFMQNLQALAAVNF